jgi:phospholipid/cholesterol/gamma-HCH transport system ATP-binding protein
MSAAAPAEAVVEVRDLRYSIGGRPIFDGLNLTVRRGEITAVMGPSGTGKTTLLRLMMGAIRPDSGDLTIFGERPWKLGRAALYALRRRVGMLFQNGALMSDLDVFENVAFPLRAHTRLPEPLLRRLVLMKLQAVGLRGAAEFATGSLSGGMARRVALARAIVMDPELLIYDEPFAGLDPISLAVILRLIQTLNATLGITSIVVTHDVEEISQIAHSSFLLAGGKAAAHGTPAELRATEAPVVRQFMSGLPDGPMPFHVPAPDYREQLLGKG